MLLTEKQAAVLAFIEGFQGSQGSFPTLREIQSHFGFASPFSANKHVLALEKKGVLERGHGRARSLVLKNRPPVNLRHIPIFGTIPAGLPSEQEQEADRYISLDSAMFGLSPQAEIFGLTVRGDSMIDAHILDGDLAVMERKPAKHRDIVAALIDGETTLKRLIIESGQKYLKAENPRYADLTPARELIVQGVLRTVIRTKPL